jgi:hypothetical protein
MKVAMNSKVQGSHEVATRSRDNPPMISHIFLRWVKLLLDWVQNSSKLFKTVANKRKQSLFLAFLIAWKCCGETLLGENILQFVQ